MRTSTLAALHADLLAAPPPPADATADATADGAADGAADAGSASRRRAADTPPAAAAMGREAVPTPILFDPWQEPVMAAPPRPDGLPPWATVGHEQVYFGSRMEEYCNEPFLCCRKKHAALICCWVACWASCLMFQQLF